MLISALFWPFWITSILFIVFTLVFEDFYPGLVIIFVTDAIFSFETMKIAPVYGVLTIGAIISYVLLHWLRNKILVLRH